MKIISFCVPFATLLILSLASCEKSLMLILGEKPAKFVMTNVDTVATVNGILGKTAHCNFEKLLVDHPEVNTLILENVPGSINDDYNIQTGNLIRDLGFTTQLISTSEIASGGVDLFCAGLHRDIEEGARLGVHSWNGGRVEAGDLPHDDPQHDDLITFCSKMLGDSLGPLFYFYTIYAAPADSIHWMTQEEIDQYGLDN